MRPLAFALGALLIAGCSSPATPSTDPTLQFPGSQPAGLAVPSWTVGEWWNFSTSSGSAVTYAVSGETSMDWMLDVDNSETAFRNALSDISTVGPQRKADLAGSQGTDRVEFFRWPLRGGMNWTTSWDHEPVTITTKDAGPGKVDMTAKRADGSLYAEYTYDNATHWLHEILFYDGPGGQPFGLTLQAHGYSYAGLLKRWKVETLLEYNGTEAAIQQSADLALPAGTTDLLASYTFTCTNGAYDVTIGPLGPDAPNYGYQDHQACGAPGVTATIIIPPAGGTWGYSFACVSVPQPAATISLMVRTLTIFGVGKAP